VGQPRIVILNLPLFELGVSFHVGTDNPGFNVGTKRGPDGHIAGDVSIGAQLVHQIVDRKTTIPPKIGIKNAAC